MCPSSSGCSSHIVSSYVAGGLRVPPPQDIKGSGKAEGGEPSLGQGTGLGSLVRGREPVLRGGTPSPGEMRGGGTGSQHLWVLIPGSGVRECLPLFPPHALRPQSSLPCAPGPDRPWAGASSQKFWPSLPPASQPSAPSDGFLHPCGQVQASLCLSCHLCKMIGEGEDFV